MNIALVSEFFPPYVTGGAEIFLERLANYLRKDGHNIVVVTTDQGQGTGDFKTYKVKSSPLHVSHRYQFHGLTLPWMFSNRRLAKRIEGIYKKESIDMVYLNNLFHVSFAPLQAAETMNIPAVLDVHDYWPICFTKDFFHKGTECKTDGIIKCSRCVAGKMGTPILWPLLMPGLLAENRMKARKLSSATIREVICHSKEGVEQLKEYGIKSTSIPYPYIGKTKKHKCVDDGVFRVLFVGRLDEVKGAGLLPEIASRLKAKGMNFRMDVIGDGPLREMLDRKDLNMHVHGFMKEERFEYFERADCLLALHQYPVPFGIIVIEAMAYQVPVVAIKGSGPSFLVEENGIGIVTEKGKLSNAVSRLYSDKRLAETFRKNCRKNLKTYSSAIIMRRYRNLFNTVLKTYKKQGGKKSL